ncbi:SDR family oxidoreductase [Streptomyces sp. NPDC002454]
MGPMAIHVITGAGSGIGEAVAWRLHARGDDLVLLARDAGRAKELAARFPGSRTLVGDLADPEKLSWAFSHQTLPDRVDSLIHSAGVIDLGPVGELTPKTWRHQLNVNLIAPAELTRHFLPQLRVTQGHVLFVNSGSGLRARADWSAYAASKHGLRALADALREEEQAGGVRVTSVYPGRTASAMQAKVHQQEGREYDPARWSDPETVATTVLTALDLPRDSEINDLSVRPAVR